MYIPFNIFETVNKSLIRNYLRYSGWIVIEKFFEPAEVNQFIDAWEQNFEMIAAESAISVPNYKHAESFCERVIPNWYSVKLLDIVNELIGYSAIFFGSSGTGMKVPTPWHRDLYIGTPVYKLATYLDNTDETTGGELCVIQGTQNPKDLYSQIMNQILGWPEGSGIRKDNQFFPKLQERSGATTIDAYPLESREMCYLSFQKLRATSRDLVIFDQRIVHGSTIYRDGRLRRMIQSSFFVNPSDKNFREEVEGVYYGNQTDLEKEIQNILALESRNTENGLYSHLTNSATLLQLMHNYIPSVDLRLSNQGVKGNRKMIDSNLEFFRKNIKEFDNYIL